MHQNQHKSSNPESSGSDQTTSKKDEGQDPTLDEIVKDLTSYLKKFSHFKKYEKDIRKKYEKYYNTALPDRWPVEFINKAWIKTKTEMYTFSGRRKCWSLAILLQLMRRSQGYDESEGEELSDQKQSGGDGTAPVYIRIPFLEMIKDNKCKAQDTNAMDILESPQNKYKLIDKVPSPTQILQKHSYVTLYNNQTRSAVWVYEILNESTVPKKEKNKSTEPNDDKNKSTRAKNVKNKSTLPNKKVVKRSLFKKDTSVHTLFQTPESQKTYRKKDKDKDEKLDKGHLAAAANHMWCQKACDDTFLLSNIVPQQHNFNCGLWKTLENFCKTIAQKEEVRNVHVYSGPLYLSSDNKKDNNDQNKSEKSVEYKFVGGKAVPTHLFKVIIVEKMNGEVLEPLCYKIPNESHKESHNESYNESHNELSKELRVKRKLFGEQHKNLPKESSMESFKRKRIQSESIETYLNKLKKFNVSIEDIQRDSGLIFKEKRTTTEEMEDRTWKVCLMKNPDEEIESGEEIEIEVRVSGLYVDHSDRAVLH